MRGSLRTGLLLALYLALCLAPLALAWDFRHPRHAWRNELSSGLAMAGFAVVLAEFALSGRFRRLSARVGMDLTMRLHQGLALAALAFLLVHPFLYRYGSPSMQGAGVVLPLPAGLTGAAAWALLLLTVAFAWFRRDLPWSYEAWRLAHGVGALAIAAFGLHHALAAGRYAQDPWLRGYWIAGVALAAASIIRVYVVKPLLQPRWRVAEVAPAAEQIWRLALEPQGRRRFGFTAGQFVWLKLGQAFGNLDEHPLSIASAPSQLPRLEFLVKEAGDFTRALARVAPGTAAYVDGPYGHFTLEGRERAGVMLIAGGVGIAPILSLARELAAAGDARPLKIVYADAHEGQLAARAELEAIARGAPGRELHLVLGAFLDEARLRGLLPPAGADPWLYFLCGPPAMVDAVEVLLGRLGIPLPRIVSERFVHARGIVSPRERLTRAAIGGAALALALAALAFSLR